MSESPLAEEFLPVWDVSDAVATVIEADRESAYRALLDVDLLEVGREAPLVGVLGALRMLPEVAGHVLHGERPAKPDSMRLRDMPEIPTATTDEHARRWFRRYWTFGVGSGAHILVGSLLESARRAAEHNAEG
jgi:hypothetical protein